MRTGRKIQVWANTGVALALVTLVGCGYAKRDQVDAQFAQMRTDMESADQSLGTRISEVDGRVTQLDGRVNGVEGRTQALERDLSALRTEFNAKIEELEGQMAFSVPVHFDYDGADIREQDRMVLERFASVIKSYYPQATVTVEGFTDPAGSTSYNQRLGLRRAEAVKEYLVGSGGIMPETVRTVSYGESKDRLVTDAWGPEAGFENRRVSIVIDYAAVGNAPRIITNPENGG
jgi:peptidoglycan-associated lipoprotein